MHKVMLTFDVEDFINPRSIMALYKILGLLRKYDFKALFFITGHMAEKLRFFPEILALLEAHEIGYHSSSHSVRPIIFEYTDLEDYEEARLASIKRETAHINPLTGEIEGKGGIVFLRELFPNKKIVAFRAPGYCWSPPHLDAITELGIQFDFSACISRSSVHYKRITFYPRSVRIDGFPLYGDFFGSISGDDVKVFVSHPSSFVNSKEWDCIYWQGNPEKLSDVPPRSWKEMEYGFLGFELLLKWLKLLQGTWRIKVAPDLTKSRTKLTIRKADVLQCYRRSLKWAKDFFNYEPKFQRVHFLNFFDIG